MVLIAVESLTWGEIWTVTGLGFGIVLALLFCLVFIMQGLGQLMQRITAPKAAPASKAAPQAVQAPKVEPIANDKDNVNADEMAAIAMALYFSRAEKHDLPNARIYLQAHETAWNAKELGLNNKGF